MEMNAALTQSQMHYRYFIVLIRTEQRLIRRPVAPVIEDKFCTLILWTEYGKLTVGLCQACHIATLIIYERVHCSVAADKSSFTIFIILLIQGLLLK